MKRESGKLEGLILHVDLQGQAVGRCIRTQFSGYLEKVVDIDICRVVL